jgi:hypothetical protein
MGLSSVAENYLEGGEDLPFLSFEGGFASRRVDLSSHYAELVELKQDLVVFVDVFVIAGFGERSQNITAKLIKEFAIAFSHIASFARSGLSAEIIQILSCLFSPLLSPLSLI